MLVAGIGLRNDQVVWTDCHLAAWWACMGHDLTKCRRIVEELAAEIVLARTTVQLLQERRYRLAEKLPEVGQA